MDHGKWHTPTWGKKAVEYQGPYKIKWSRVNPEGEFTTHDRAWRK